MRRISGWRLWLVGIGLLCAAPAAAQDFAGEYTMMYQGTEVLAIHVQPGGAGNLSGSVSSGGVTLPFTGSVRDGVLSFTTRGEDGQTSRWEARVEPGGLAVTLFYPGEPAERFSLTRRGTGWSGDSTLAREWTQRLTGSAFTITERTGGGDSGGAVRETHVSFCAGGRAMIEENFTLAVTLPGLGGSRTSRESSVAGWEIVTRGAEASLRLEADGGEAFQAGLASGSEPDILLLAGTPVRLRSAGTAC